MSSLVTLVAVSHILLPPLFWRNGSSHFLLFLLCNAETLGKLDMVLICFKQVCCCHQKKENAIFLHFFFLELGLLCYNIDNFKSMYKYFLIQLF